MWVVAQICSHAADHIAMAAPCQSNLWCDAEVKFALHSFVTHMLQLQNELQPLQELRFTPRANYQHQGLKNSTLNQLFSFKKQTHSGAMSELSNGTKNIPGNLVRLSLQVLLNKKKIQNQSNLSSRTFGGRRDILYGQKNYKWKKNMKYQTLTLWSSDL
jgi:hypothetical protein